PAPAGAGSSINASNTAPTTFRLLVPCKILARIYDLRAGLAPTAGLLDDFTEVFARFGGVAELRCGFRRACKGAKPVRLLFQRRLEGRQRLLRIAAVEQHLAIELARRFGNAGWHRMLLVTIVRGGSIA